LEEVKPLEPEQTNANTQSAARRNFARAAPPAVASPGAAPSIQSSAALGDVTQTAALLDQGAPVDAPDEMGRTPLMLAVMQNRPAVVRLLLARGADPNAADNTGHTPLQQAKQENLRDVAAMLERAGAR
jgi:ankyrin repeat protein